MTKLQVLTANRNVRRFPAQLHFSMIALAVMYLCPLRAHAQHDHAYTPTAEQQDMTSDQRTKFGALLKIVRESTERFKDVSVAEGEGYALQFGSVSGPDSRAMGLHYVNANLVEG